MTPYYQDDLVTIYHGDCREVLPYLGLADVLITDPPYGIGLRYDVHDDTAADYDDLMAEVRRLTDDIPMRLITPGVLNAWRWPAPTWVLSWFKPGAPGRSRLLQAGGRGGAFNEWEPVLVYGRARFTSDVIRALIQYPGGNGNAALTFEHPCPKPLSLLRALIAGSTEPGQLVLDPFAGSGTTLVAAKEAGRRAIGVELSERYCEIAAQRCSQEVLGLAV